MKYLISILLVVASLLAGAQPSASKFGKVWVNGTGISYKCTFNGTNVTTGFNDTSNSPYFGHGHSDICDSNGNLIITCNGYNLYNSNGDFLDNGDTLAPLGLYSLTFGISSSPQTSIILPFANKKYYMINAVISDSLLNAPSGQCADILFYHVIDMNFNNGAGKVIRREVPLLKSIPLSWSQMTACKHANGKDWWLLKQGHDSNIVYKFLFKQDTVIAYPPQRFLEPHFAPINLSGQSVFSPDGKKYATTCRSAYKIFLADFDRCSGNLSNPQVIDVPRRKTHNPYDTAQTEGHSESLAFSPNGNMLYLGMWYNVQQLDLLDNNPDTKWTNVAGLDTTWDAFMDYGCLQLGTDNRIYVGNWNGASGQMSVINSPDNKGAGCSFCPRCLRFPMYYWYSNGQLDSGYSVTSPPNMPNYALGATNPICFPVEVNEPVKAVSEFELYPNPATSMVTVSYNLSANETGIVRFYDQLGRTVETVLLPSGQRYRIPLNNITPGFYYYNFIVNNTIQKTGKLIIE